MSVNGGVPYTTRICALFSISDDVNIDGATSVARTHHCVRNDACTADELVRVFNFVGADGGEPYSIPLAGRAISILKVSSGVEGACPHRGALPDIYNARDVVRR